MVNPQLHILVSIENQLLQLLTSTGIISEYSINTAKNGAGERQGSECTPRGLHQIRAKIGVGQRPNSVFVGRRLNGEIYSSELAENHPQRDWVLSRILWLSGLEVGVNRLGNVDTMRRYIYIHGSPDHSVATDPESHGCIRMNSKDVIDLFDQVEIGTKVNIV
jgi:hypothetical protein